MNAQGDLFADAAVRFKGSPAQQANIARVHAKIAPIIARFFHERGLGFEFHVDDLRRYVAKQYPTYATVAPDSSGRIMRDMRERAWIDYVVVNRRQSLYRITSIGEEDIRPG